MKEYHVGFDSNGHYDELERTLNKKAAAGWRLVALDVDRNSEEMLFVLERDKEESKEAVLLRQLLRASGHEPEA